jgi:hypothetical protein
MRALLLCLPLVAGCFDVPALTGDVLCAVDDDCPAEQVCALARHLCTAPGSDLGAPKIESAAFTPAALNEGVATLIITANEPLGGTPIVDAPLPLLLSATDGVTQTMIVDVTDLDDGGYPIASITVTDAAGNPGTTLLNGLALVVDRLPPELFNARTLDPPAVYADTGPASAITIAVAANEPLAALTLAIPGSSSSSCDPLTLTCTATLSAAVVDGVSPVVTGVDAAGNASSVTLAPIDVDTAAPAVIAGSVSVRIVRGGQDVDVVSVGSFVTLSFTTSEPVDVSAAVAVVDDGGVAVPLAFDVDGSAGQRLSFTLDGPGAIANGEHVVRATLVDPFGHEATVDVVPALPFGDDASCFMPGARGLDVDGDGHFSTVDCEGDDADDGSPLVNVSVPEIPGDGLDNDQQGGDQLPDDDDGVFCDPSSAVTPADGTRAAPFTSFDDAVAALDDDAFLFLAASDVAFAFAAAEVANVSIVGGLEPAAGWTFAGGRSALATEVLLTDAGVHVVSGIATPRVVVNNLAGTIRVFAAHVDVDELDAGLATLVALDLRASHVRLINMDASFFNSDLRDVVDDGGPDSPSLTRSFFSRSIVRGGARLLGVVVAVNTAFLADAGSPLSPLTGTTGGSVALFHCALIAGAAEPVVLLAPFVELRVLNSLLLRTTPGSAIEHDARSIVLVGNAFVGGATINDGDLSEPIDNTCAFRDCTLAGGNINVAPGDAGLATLFHLGDGSELQNAAVTDNTLGAPTSVAADFDGDCRFIDSAPDIGVDER